MGSAVIGLDVGEAEAEAFWREFLRDLVKRGLTGAQLGVSDAREGLKAAIAPGAGLILAKVVADNSHRARHVCSEAFRLQ